MIAWEPTHSIDTRARTPAACRWDLSLHAEGTAIDFATCTSTLNRTRPPLTSPPQLAAELRSGVLFFTSGMDPDVLSEVYARLFVDALDTFHQHLSTWPNISYRISAEKRFSCKGVDFRGVGWDAADVSTLVAALAYAEAHCRPRDEAGKEDARLTVELTSNRFSEHDKARLLAAVPGGSTKFDVHL